MTEPERFFCCSMVGINVIDGKIWTSYKDKRYEVRGAIALFGDGCGADESIAQGLSPFDKEFQGNYCSGTGDTQEEAMENLRKDVAKVYEGLWG